MFCYTSEGMQRTIVLAVDQSKLPSGGFEPESIS